MPDFSYHPAGEAPRPLHAGSILPDAAIDRITGLSRFTKGTVPFVRPGEAHDGFPILRWKRDKVGNAGTWIIEDTQTDVERMVLRVEGERYRQSTRCKDGEEERAADMFMFYVGSKRNRLLGVLMPTQVEYAQVLLEFLRHLESGAHNLDPATVRSYCTALKALTGFYGYKRLGETTENLSMDYIEWRTAQPIKKTKAKDPSLWTKPPSKRCKKRREKGPVKLVSFKQATKDLETLRTAFNWYRYRTQLNYDVRIFIPDAPKPPVTWLRRRQLARYFWALRGRIWNAEKGRWRIRRDDDPSLVGEEGDKRVLRPEKTVAARRNIARMFLIGVYQGSRVRSILETSYKDEQTAHIDWARGVINRRGLNEKESLKRRPSVLMVPKVRRFVRNWARRDAEKGFHHMIHTVEGRPFRTNFANAQLLDVDTDAGVGKHVTMHVLRHTVVMWMKQESVSVWSAANFLGCPSKVLEERYGMWDIESQVEVVNALTKAKQQKAAAAQLEEDGLAAL